MCAAGLTRALMTVDVAETAEAAVVAEAAEAATEAAETADAIWRSIIAEVEEDHEEGEDGEGRDGKASDDKGSGQRRAAICSLHNLNSSMDRTQKYFCVPVDLDRGNINIK